MKYHECKCMKYEILMFDAYDEIGYCHDVFFYWFVRFAWVNNIMHELVIVWDIPCFEYFPLSVIA